jgi:hypothetical protein
MWRKASWWLPLALALGGCSTFDPKHPLVGKPSIETAMPSYWVWYADSTWHLRMTAGGRGHRFQGSMSGVRGGVAEMVTTRPELKNSIALVGDAVQFDVDGIMGAEPDGFDAHVIGSCARFELLIDGKPRAEQVRLGPRALPARRVPFERCP